MAALRSWHRPKQCFGSSHLVAKDTSLQFALIDRGHRGLQRLYRGYLPISDYEGCQMRKTEKYMKKCLKIHENVCLSVSELFPGKTAGPIGFKLGS